MTSWVMYKKKCHLIYKLIHYLGRNRNVQILVGHPVYYNNKSLQSQRTKFKNHLLKIRRYQKKNLHTTSDRRKTIRAFQSASIKYHRYRNTRSWLIRRVHKCYAGKYILMWQECLFWDFSKPNDPVPRNVSHF